MSSRKPSIHNHHKQQSLKQTNCTKCGTEIQVIHVTPGVKCWECEKYYYYHRKND